MNKLIACVHLRLYVPAYRLMQTVNRLIAIADSRQQIDVNEDKEKIK